MRKSLFIFSILLTVPIIAQNYKPLLDNQNEWQVTNCYHGCLTDIYYTDGDTLVGGKTYKILDGFHYISRTFLLREDVASKKVYLNLVQKSGNSEYLLYDFSLNVGDSIDIKNPISPFPQDAGFYKMDSIVSQPLVDGNSYRHFYLSPTASNTINSTPAVWIEGVGSLSLINAPGGFPDINAAGALTCFFKNGQLFYSIKDNCESLGIGNELAKYPLKNITLNTLINDGECKMNNTQNIGSIAIFDLSGRKLSERKTNGENPLNLDFSNVSSGIYLIIAQSVGFEKKVFRVLVQ